METSETQDTIENEIESALGPFPTITTASLLRTRFSDSALNPLGIESENRRLRDKGILFPQRSELVLTTAQKLKRKQDLDQPVTDEEYISASLLLENLVNESQNKKLRVVTLPGGKKVVNLFEGQSSEYKDRVYELVYGTMKYLGVIDTILVKTQFLVYNSQFLNNLCLIKVMLFELMKRHFDYSKKSGIQYITNDNEKAVEIVREIAEAFRGHQTKLAAAFARIRIEKHASGNNFKEQLENILPEEVRRKESVAVDMPKHMRINTLKCSQQQVIAMLMDRGCKVCQGSHSPPVKCQGDDTRIIKMDADFSTLLEMSATLFHEIKNSHLVSNGYLIPQDKASFLGPQILAKKLQQEPELEIIDVRAGSGTKTCHLAALASNKGRIFAFENRRAQIETLTGRLKVCSVKNVDIIEADFLNTDTNDERFSKVSIVFIEPPSSGTAIVDKLEYLLQEKEFPFEEYTERDLDMLRKNQINVLRHAFEFPNVQTVIYITRSENIEENEEIVSEALDENTFDLECILPEHKTDRSPNAEYNECFKMDASDYGNGTFVACFERIPVPEPSTERLEDGENDLSTRVNSMEIIEEGQSLYKKKKSGLGSKVNRRRTKSLTAIQNTRNESATLARMPPVFQRLTSRQKLGQAQLQTKGRKFEKEEDESTDEEVASDDNEDPAAHHERRQRRRERKGSAQQVKYTMSLGVFGLSLKHFYAPKHAAIVESRKSVPDLTSTRSKSWIYPVPNPRPWF